MSKFDMLKKAGSMRKQMKQMQKNMAKQTAEATSGAVTVVARGDMSLAEVRIDPEKANFEKIEQVQKQIVAAANSALSSVQKTAAMEMAKNSGGLGGLTDMLGG